jgi:ParE-like toxin of type II ParDE toxin-antitoxin system
LALSPRRVGKPLFGPLAGCHGARRGTYRVVYRIDEQAHVVEVLDIDHRADIYHRSLTAPLSVDEVLAQGGGRSGYPVAEQFDRTDLEPAHAQQAADRRCLAYDRGIRRWPVVLTLELRGWLQDGAL